MKRLYVFLIPILIFAGLIPIIYYIPFLDPAPAVSSVSCDLTKHVLASPVILSLEQNQINGSFSSVIPRLSVCSFVQLSVAVDFSALTTQLQFVQIYVRYTNLFNATSLQLILNAQTSTTLVSSGSVLFEGIPNSNITVFSVGNMPNNYNVKIVLTQLAHA